MHARSMTTRCVHRVRELEPILKLLSSPACKASVFQSSRYIVTMQRSSELLLPTYGSYILYPQSSTPSYLAVVTSDSDELCVMLFYVLFFLPPSRIIFKSLHFFTGVPTIAVQSSYTRCTSQHASAMYIPWYRCKCSSRSRVGVHVGCCSRCVATGTENRCDWLHRHIDKVFSMCFGRCPRTLATIVARLHPVNVMSNVRTTPLKFIYEGRLQEEGSFSGSGATKQTHYPRLPR